MLMPVGDYKTMENSIKFLQALWQIIDVVGERSGERFWGK
jgi:hypothetical protein